MDGITLKVEPRKISDIGKDLLQKVVPDLEIVGAQEIKSFIYNGEFFEAENISKATADCFVLMKNMIFGKIIKIFIIQARITLLIDVNHQPITKCVGHYMMLDNFRNSMICESVHNILKKAIFLNESSMLCVFPNNIECD